MSGFLVVLAAMSMSLAKPQPPDAPACAIPEARRSAMMSAPYEAFDQSMEGGTNWRAVMNAGCYETAAKLVGDYMERNRKSVSGEAMRTMSFHVGQILALAGEDARAIPSFEKARGGTAEWNAYVDSLLAFARHDRPAFDLARQAYDAAAPESPRRAALASLASCFGRPYAEAMMCEVPKP
jgi:hypothetical protein